MNLRQYIDILKSYDPEQKVRIGLGKPHSWRGVYADLAFEPVENTTIAEMLSVAENCIGKTFSGWKGGEFEMTEYTTIHVDYCGRCDYLDMFLLIQLLVQSSQFPEELVESLQQNRVYNDEPFAYNG